MYNNRITEKYIIKPHDGIFRLLLNNRKMLTKYTVQYIQ